MNANTVFFGRGYSEQGRAERAIQKISEAERVRKERRTDWRELMTEDHSE